MRTGIRIVALLLLPSLVASVLVANAFGAKHKVYFPSNCTNSRYKPTHLIAACGDAGLQVHKIKWSHYGAKSATGNGTGAANTCTPDCASGNIVHGPAKVELKRPRTCANIDRTVFTRLKVSYTGNQQPLAGQSISFPFPCSIYD